MSAVAATASVRRARRTGRSGDLSAPVISVGNLAMGGRGKTPTVAAIARLLVAAGERPALLSRGYRRRLPEDGVTVVSDGHHLRADLDRAGDEPLLLARLVPGAAVLVCDVRAEAARLAESDLGATVHVLDDGFQHRSLGKDIELVIVTPADLRDRRLPFGRLRSSPRAVARASAVLVDEAPVADVDGALDALGAPPARFALHRTMGAPWRLDGGVEAISPDRAVLAVAGIARPQRFRQALEAAGWTVNGLVPFADHHAFTRGDAGRVADAARRAGARLVLTTEKDAMRWLPLRPLPVAMAAVPLQVSIEPAPAFRRWLLDRLRQVRG